MVALGEVRVSRHLTERQRAEADTWQAWAALQQASEECWTKAQQILTPQQIAAIEPGVDAIGGAMAHVLDCGKRLLATDAIIADDARRVAR